MAKVFSWDVETNGLWGIGFAIGAVIWIIIMIILGLAALLNKPL